MSLGEHAETDRIIDTVLQMDSLATVLQEVDRFNGLLAVLRRSLGLLRKAIKGLIVMSGDLESMFDSLSTNRTPR